MKPSFGIFNTVETLDLTVCHELVFPEIIRTLFNFKSDIVHDWNNVIEQQRL